MATEKKDIHPVPAKANLKKDRDKEKSKPAPRKRRFDLKKTAIAIGHFFRDVWFELKKVTWASKKEFISYSVAVLVFVTIFGAIIFGMDTLLGWGLTGLLNLIA